MFLKQLLSITFFITFASQVFSASQGVAFIHGRGVAELANLDRATAYWGNLITNATKGNAIPHVLGHYNGTLHMRDIAPSVADQLLQFIEQHQIADNSLTIVAHSYGGVVSRFILSNQDLNPAFKKVADKVQQVITMGSPHRGSEAADLALDWSENGTSTQKWLIELLNPIDDSARLLTTTGMAYANDNCLVWGTAGCPALPKPFFLVSGGHNANLWEAALEVFELENIALAILGGMVSFIGTHDGMVSQYSAEGITQNAKQVYQSVRNHHHLRNDRFLLTTEPKLSKFLSTMIF